ncbi:MAG: hypothetical protein CMO40_07410 [Verrucomicrobiaceae bacterium]|nr:hypothetical protein [Verrucomicrobiaceae bacterium]
MVLRHITGSGFTVAMVVLIALRVPAFGFCACEENFTLTQKPCCLLETAEMSECGCCPCQVEDSTTPCSDCMAIISLDPGHFLWSADSFHGGKGSEDPKVLPGGLQVQLPLFSCSALSGVIRKSPPPRSLPAFLRSGAWRL